MRGISFLVALLVGQIVVAAPLLLHNDHLEVRFDPATLEASSGERSISSPGESVEPRELVSEATSAHWRRGDALVSVKLDADALRVHVSTEKPGTFNWPILRIAAPARGLILPFYEGVDVPRGDADWIKFLVDQGPMDTTSGLSMPFWGVRFEKSSITYILGSPFNNELAFSDDAGMLGMRLTHEFTPNQTVKAFSVLVKFTDASPVAPAKAFRQYLIDSKQFVSMKEKIARTPNAARQLGAPHFYVWGHDLLSRYDVRDWKSFATKLEASQEILATLSDEAKTQVHEMTTEPYPSDYAKRLVAGELCKLGVDKLTHTFPDAFTDPKTWGDGVSTKMLDALHDAGIDRAVLTTGDLYSAREKPQVAVRANELGYLFAPYDSYDAVHKPTETDTWETAQFDQHLYDTGGVVLRDGKKKTGFKKKGFLVNPVAARPYVEKRVNDLYSKVPFTAWFIDCDAFGEVFDDYSPLHPSTQVEFAKARCDRLAWIRGSHDLVIGSEGGTAFAAPFIHFAEGITTPVIGWGDPDLTSKASKYYLGKYFPPDGPDVFLKSVPLKPYYAKFYFDPRHRLPLYEIVFHDSVIATHHWSAASLKFADQAQTVALFEQLYNVPPLYHLNLAEWKKRRERIVEQFKFFSPVHRRLGTLAMTGFDYLSDDKLVQRTTFSDGSVIIANFSDRVFDRDGESIPAHGAAVREAADGELRVYSPPG